MTLPARARRHLSYANVTATLALFVALGGTSYAVLHIGSDDVVNNSLRSRDVQNGTLRSRDVRNGTLRGRDLRPNSIGGIPVKESALGQVPLAMNAQRLGGASAGDFRLRCPADTLPKAGVCIERSPHSPVGFFSAGNICEQAGRGLATMPQLDRFAKSSGPLPQAEWTGSLYRNPANGPLPVDQLETVLLSGVGDPSYSRVYLAVQHAFRCAALPSN
jgi:hypothetical protein